MITKAKIDEVFSNKERLGKIRKGLEKYLWLQTAFKGNGYKAKDFQRIYKGFYRVRRGNEWCSQYFALMGQSRKEKLDFETVLCRMEEKSRKLEASFASKLIATIDPRWPVIDKYVLRNFGLRLPSYNAGNRKEKIIEIYKKLSEKYGNLMRSKLGIHIRKQFDEKFPLSGITSLKKVDLVLWQIR